MSKYPFRREDNGQIVEVGFLEMMEKDAGGFITLPDGAMAREIRPSCRSREARTATNGVAPPIVSDALGFTEAQFQAFESDRIAHGFKGIEFVRDPAVPQFFRVKCNSASQWQDYVRHRGARDQNSVSGSGAGLSPQSLRQAEDLAKREFPLLNAVLLSTIAEDVAQCHKQHGESDGSDPSKSGIRKPGRIARKPKPAG